MKSQFGDRPHDGAIFDALRECCWFPFLPHRDRDAARRFSELAGSPTSSDWQQFVDYCAQAERSGADVALSAALIAPLSSHVGQERALQVVRDLGEPAKVAALVTAERDRDLANAALTGEDDVDEQTRALQRALEKLAANLAAEADGG